jgi:hypothetical protein
MKTKIQSIVCRLILSGIILCPLRASALDVLLTDDSYVSEAFPTNTNGAAVSLYVRGGSGLVCKSWFKFVIGSVLPANRTWDQVVKATLRIYVSSVTTAGAVTVKAGSVATYADGDEAVLNYSKLTDLNDPVSGQPYATQTISVGAKYYSFDVTELVRDWLDGSRANYGFSLVPGDSTVNLLIDSKEGTGTSHPASLHLVFQPRMGGAGDVSMGQFTNGPQP